MIHRHSNIHSNTMIHMLDFAFCFRGSLAFPRLPTLLPPTRGSSFFFPLCWCVIRYLSCLLKLPILPLADLEKALTFNCLPARTPSIGDTKIHGMKLTEGLAEAASPRAVHRDQLCGVHLALLRAVLKGAQVEAALEEDDGSSHTASNQTRYGALIEDLSESSWVEVLRRFLCARFLGWESISAHTETGLEGSVAPLDVCSSIYTTMCQVRRTRRQGL